MFDDCAMRDCDNVDSEAMTYNYTCKSQTFMHQTDVLR